MITLEGEFLLPVRAICKTEDRRSFLSILASPFFFCRERTPFHPILLAFSMKTAAGRLVPESDLLSP